MLDEDWLAQRLIPLVRWVKRLRCLVGRHEWTGITTPLGDGSAVWRLQCVYCEESATVDEMRRTWDAQHGIVEGD